MCAPVRATGAVRFDRMGAHAVGTDIERAVVAVVGAGHTVITQRMRAGKITLPFNYRPVGGRVQFCPSAREQVSIAHRI